MAFSTVAREFDGRDEKWKALGREPPKVCPFIMEDDEADIDQLSNQDWYERRGYQVFKRVDAMWGEVDSMGKNWPATAVFMRKDIT